MNPKKKKMKKKTHPMTMPLITPDLDQPVMLRMPTLMTIKVTTLTTATMVKRRLLKKQHHLTTK